jgi:hypothetical protein
MQVNGINHSWLIQKGIIRYPADLYNARRNLKAALAIYHLHGWRAWTTARHC